MDKPCVIGPCKCGGYGVVYDAENETKLGRCHDDIKDLHIQSLEMQRNDLLTACQSLIDLVDLAQEDVSHHEYQTIHDLTLDQAKQAMLKARASK